MEVIPHVRLPKIFSPRVLIRDSNRVDETGEQTTNVTLSLQCWEAPIRQDTCSSCSCSLRHLDAIFREHHENTLLQHRQPAYEHVNTSLSAKLDYQHVQLIPRWQWLSEGPQDLRTSSSPGKVLPSRENRRTAKSPLGDDVTQPRSPDYQKSSRTHFKGKTKLFKCPYCDISCSNRGQLLGHIRIHTGERPFICQEPGCEKAFIRNEELTRHRRIHTGERPYVCETCKKAFTRKDHLNKHIKIHTASDDIFTV